MPCRRRPRVFANHCAPGPSPADDRSLDGVPRRGMAGTTATRQRSAAQPVLDKGSRYKFYSVAPQRLHGTTPYWRHPHLPAAHSLAASAHRRRFASCTSGCPASPQDERRSISADSSGRGREVFVTRQWPPTAAVPSLLRPGTSHFDASARVQSPDPVPLPHWVAGAAVARTLRAMIDSLVRATEEPVDAVPRTFSALNTVLFHSSGAVVPRSIFCRVGITVTLLRRRASWNGGVGVSPQPRGRPVHPTPRRLKIGLESRDDRQTDRSQMLKRPHRRAGDTNSPCLLSRWSAG